MGTQVKHMVSQLSEIREMIVAMRSEYVRKDHHDFKVSSLEDRVANIERQREEERKHGGMLGWWKNVTAIFAGLAVIATVVGVVVSLGVRISGVK